MRYRATKTFYFGKSCFLVLAKRMHKRNWQRARRCRVYLRKLKGHTHAEARRYRKIKVANLVVLRTAKIRGNAFEIIGNVGEEGSSRVETLEASKKKTTMPRSL